jgi:hypothetical protein
VTHRYPAQPPPATAAPAGKFPGRLRSSQYSPRVRRRGRTTTQVVPIVVVGLHGHLATSAQVAWPAWGLPPPFFYFPQLHLDNLLGRPTLHPCVAQVFPARVSRLKFWKLLFYCVKTRDLQMQISRDVLSQIA